jgi:hypothetical protein
MAEANRMRLGSYAFAIEAASFRRITQSWSGPGWDFSFSGPCLNDPEGIFPLGARLLTEAAPLPFEKAQDYAGVDLQLPMSYDDETGEPFFGLNVGEEHEVSRLRLRFCERAGSRYRIEIAATISETVLGHPERLELSAWAVELPDHAYPS